MLEDLIGDDHSPTVRETSTSSFVGLDRASPGQLLGAQVATAAWLEEMGLTEGQILPKLEREAAAKAFGAMTTGQPDDVQTGTLLELKTPEAVRQVVGMLTAYDWEFVEQAKQLRGYVVAKLVEESANPNANIRIKALIALGKVTEVGLFTDKVELKKTEQTDEEVNSRIKDKIAAFLKIEDAPAPVDDVLAKPEATPNGPA